MLELECQRLHPKCDSRFSGSDQFGRWAADRSTRWTRLGSPTFRRRAPARRTGPAQVRSRRLRCLRPLVEVIDRLGLPDMPVELDVKLRVGTLAAPEHF